MSSQRTLIIPWLTSKIGDPDYPGLTWMNSEHTQFRIPWKHGLRHDRSDVEIKIFEGWAIENGTYHPGIDKPNPAVWKRNLRSALNRKSEVQMIQDHSSDSSDPHKVYEIISQSSRAGQEPNEESQEPDDGIGPAFDSTRVKQDPCYLFNLSTVRQVLEPLTNPLPGPEDNYAAFPVQEQHRQESNPLEQFLPDNILEENYGAIPVQEPPPQENNPVEQFFPNNLLVENYPTLSAQVQTPQETNPLQQFFPNNMLVTDFDVNVYYRGSLVLNKTVQNTCGMRFTSSTAPWTRPDLEDIVLPKPSMSDQEVVRMINKVLNSLVPGVVMEVQGGTIRGMRQGKCRGFWTMTEFPPRGECQELQKDEYTPMYTSQQFVSELIGFIQQRRNESPLYSIWLSLGDLWPDPNEKPWTKKFIMVKVTPVVFRLLHEMSYSTGASSLSSSEMNLQISDSLSSGNLLNFLQEWEEKMEIEFGS